MWKIIALSLIGLAVAATGAGAADPSFTLVIEDHRFEPAEVRVPAGTAFELVVKNADATPEEFESHDLDLEKVIPGGGEALFRIDPLEPGTYEFFGEFNPDTARGSVIAE